MFFKFSISSISCERENKIKVGWSESGRRKEGKGKRGKEERKQQDHIQALPHGIYYSNSQGRFFDANRE